MLRTRLRFPGRASVIIFTHLLGLLYGQNKYTVKYFQVYKAYLISSQMYFEWEGAPNSNVHFYPKCISIRFFILFFAFKKLEGWVGPSFYSSLPSCFNHPAPLCSIKEPPQILTTKYDFPQKLLTRDICKIFVLICQTSWPNMAILRSCNKT